MLFVCVGDGAAAKSLGLRAETATIWPSCLSHVNQRKPTNPVVVVYRPNDHTGCYNKKNPNVIPI